MREEQTPSTTQPSNTSERPSRRDERTYAETLRHQGLPFNAATLAAFACVSGICAIVASIALRSWLPIFIAVLGVGWYALWMRLALGPQQRSNETCRECGYSLTHTPFQAPCPECGWKREPSLALKPNQQPSPPSARGDGRHIR